MRRRSVLTWAGALVAALALSGCGGGSGPAHSPSPSASTRAGTLFGMDVWQEGGQSYAQALTAVQGSYASLQEQRVFLPGDASTLPAWGSTRLDTTKPVVVSFKATPASILSGTYDAAYKAWFAAAPRDRDVYWVYFHEPEDEIAAGDFTAGDYRAAWSRLAGIADQAHNPRLHATLTLMAWTLNPASGRSWKDYYPGDDVIDVLAWDVYNLDAKKGVYADPATLFQPVIDASASVGKAWAVAEWGSLLVAGDDGTQRAAWITACGAFVKAHGALFATYFDADVNGDFKLRDPASQSALRALF